MNKQGLEWLWHLPARGRVINLQNLAASLNSQSSKREKHNFMTAPLSLHPRYSLVLELEPGWGCQKLRGLGWASWGEIDGVEIGTSVGMSNVET